MMSNFDRDIIDMHNSSVIFPNTLELQLNNLIGLFLQKEMFELGEISEEEYKRIVSTNWDIWVKLTTKIIGGQ